MAFVVVQHLDSTHPNSLIEILAKATTMPVSEVRDGMLVRPNEVYVIAPETDMILEEGQLRLMSRKKSPTVHLPINLFFNSLASECGFRAAGVLLAGTGTDGTAGLKVIKSRRGRTFAQDGTAIHAGMRNSQESLGFVDSVASPERIAAELVAWSRHPITQVSIHETSRIDPEDLIEDDQHELNQILKMLSMSSEIDFRYYKVSTIRRRLERRMACLRIPSLEGYLDRLLADPSELEKLEQEMLIHGTSFFRDAATFETLKSTVLPRLTTNRPNADVLRVWVPGCSSGEEVYSIVICILEFLEAQNLQLPIKVFATDASEQILATAQSGKYSDNITNDVSPERLQRFFTHRDDGYQINQTVREVCVFARQDITQDPPFSKMDMISCCNVMMYLDPVLQSRLFPIFHYALKPNGFLILRPSESPVSFSDFFVAVDKQSGAFQRIKTGGRVPFNFSIQKHRHSSPLTRWPVEESVLRGYDLCAEADRVVLNRHAPSGVVIDADFKIVQFRGHTGKYLEQPPGIPTFDLLQMLRPDILPALTETLKAAQDTGLPARKEQLEINNSPFSLEVIPITVPSGGLRYYLVLFEEMTTPPDESTAVPTTQRLAAGSEETQRLEIIRLKQELAETKAHLHSVIEAKDIANEEMRAANEQVESVNDELTNLFSCLRLPIVIVGQDLRVRRFTPCARDAFNLLPGDVGRLVTELSLRINVPDLRSQIVQVIDTLEACEQEVTDLNGYCYTLVIRPFQTSDHKIDGVIILLLNIDSLKERERLIIEARDFARSIFETVDESLLVLIEDDGFRIQKANKAFYNTFQITPEETENQFLFRVRQGEWDIPDLRSRLESVASNKGDLLTFRIERDFSGIGKRVLLLNVRRLPASLMEATPQRVLLGIKDITVVEAANESLRLSEALMETIIEQAANAIITINENGIIQVFNRVAERMFEYLAADVIGKNISLLMPQPYCGEHEGYLKRYLETGVKRIIGIGRVVLCRRSDGSTFPAELTIREIILKTGRIFTGILVDITERHALEREVLDIATHEQQRIGQDLHDMTGQELTGLSYLAQSLADSLRQKQLPEHQSAARLVSGLESALRQVRSIAKGLVLVNLDSEGLTTALQSLAKEIQSISGIACHFVCDQSVLLDDSQIATQLFLIAREAINNCIKHSQAHQIRVTLGIVNNVAVLEVWDDGVGIPEDYRTNGIGLHVMAYRANAMSGSLTIEENDRGGTRVLCRIPLSHESDIS